MQRHHMKMTPNEVEGWLSALAPTDRERLLIIEDLLTHSGDQEWDEARKTVQRDTNGAPVLEMSFEDKIICQLALAILRSRQ